MLIHSWQKKKKEKKFVARIAITIGISSMPVQPGERRPVSFQLDLNLELQHCYGGAGRPHEPGEGDTHIRPWIAAPWHLESRSC